MGEGRLVSPPSVDTGLRVAWARSGILSEGMRSKIPREEFWANLGFWNLFLCCTSLTLILTWSKLYYSVLSGVELVLGLRWTGTLNTKNYTTRSTGDLLVLIWSFNKDFKKKNTDSQQWRRIAALVCNGSGQSWCKIFHFWTRQPMSHKGIVFIFPPSGKPPSTKKWLYLAIFAPISLL